VIRSGPANFFIYIGDEGVICIDSGYSKNKAMRELRKAELDADSVTHLFLTHSDIDHTGGINLFKNAELFLPEDEEQMTTRKKARLFGFIYNPKIKRDYDLIRDGDEIKVGLTRILAISTPGHTPGSMSYLINESFLFVGDTMKLLDKKAYILRKYINTDTTQAKESVRKLARLENIELACTSHTGYTMEYDKAMSDWR